TAPLRPSSKCSTARVSRSKHRSKRTSFVKSCSGADERFGATVNVIHGPSTLSGTIFLLAGLVAASHGICMLVADVVAISYIFSNARVSSRFYWTTFVVVIIMNLVLISAGDGFWWIALTGPPS